MADIGARCVDSAVYEAKRAGGSVGSDDTGD